MTAITPLTARCPRCGRTVLEVRWDWQEDLLVGAPVLDLVALDQAQQFACVLTGVRLWQVYPYGRRWVTSQWNRWWPGRRDREGHTVPAHSCDRRWDAPAVSIAPDPTQTPTVCPF
ncbi:hypothetical protein [Microbacterium sp. KR10-403]|uniref:hypothetical protein n=1 Tax=Microbacterium sp. KR10-403 TaxID=3158581 RepID=UPI0032E38DB8